MPLASTTRSPRGRLTTARDPMSSTSGQPTGGSSSSKHSECPSTRAGQRGLTCGGRDGAEGHVLARSRRERGRARDHQGPPGSSLGQVPLACGRTSRAKLACAVLPPQESRADALVDHAHQRGGCHVLRAPLPRRHRLPEEVQPPAAAQLLHPAVPGGSLGVGTRPWAVETSMVCLP